MKNTKKEIEFFGKKYCYIYIKDYISINKNRGTSFTNKKFNLTYYMVKNCLSIGKYSQLLLPIENNKDYTLVFEESFVYDHDDNGRWSQLYHTFNEDEELDFINLDEAVPLYHVWSNNFWHWTLECLPKLLILEDQRYTGKYIVNNSKFIIESLKLFNIDEERICYSDKNYIVKNLIIPPMYGGYDLVKNTILIEYLRGKLLDAIGILQGNKHIYIKRTIGRIVLNEDKIIDILKKYDFEVIVPEDYSFQDQFSLMTNVDFSVTAHGANSTLILTQKMNSVFMEFFSSAYTAYHTAGITKTLSLDYIPLVENRDRPIILNENETGQYCNITVPITIFEVLVSNIVKRITKKILY